ncbi:HK97 family phage prohead protease [Aerococcus christensenii]|uniref:HK97 family phage prohead protease n=1 Tax=Aerococcus christensenii TaxID=87541 RepID=UPI00215294DA|nr:HK97 family phage prohead protease [Aerococcus christensenii]
MKTKLELRENKENNTIKIVGYALKFNRKSEDLGYIETIDPKALENADVSNVVALINHDQNYVLGRTGHNLDLEVDEIGLKFTLTPVRTSYVNDLLENMRMGLIDKCSFAFTVSEDGDYWEEKDGKWYRTIQSINKLYDVSVVTSPAYEDTEAVLSERSLDDVKRKRDIAIMEMELEI